MLRGGRGARRSGLAIGRLACPLIPAAGLSDLGRKRLAEGVGDEPRGAKDATERDAMLVARRIEQVDEVLRREVAGRARSVRAATGPTGRRVERPDARVARGR